MHYYVSAVYVSSCLSVHTCWVTPWPRLYTDSPHRPPGQRIHVYCSCSSIFSSSNQSRSLLSSAPVILFTCIISFLFAFLPLFFPLFLFLFSPSLPRLASRLQPGEDSFFSISATVLYGQLYFNLCFTFISFLILLISFNPLSSRRISDLIYFRCPNCLSTP